MSHAMLLCYSTGTDNNNARAIFHYSSQSTVTGDQFYAHPLYFVSGLGVCTWQKWLCFAFHSVLQKIVFGSVLVLQK